MSGGGRSILVHLGAGVGNVIQATPMINCLSRAGLTIDLCIQGDYADIPDLFRDWRAVRTISSTGEEFVANSYDYYIIGICMTGEPVLFKNIDTAVFLRLGYSYRDIQVVSEAGLYLNVARAIDPGIESRYETYCGSSRRRFPEISPSTCVIAPGSNFVYSIRRWDKYDLLASRLGDVAVVGLQKDLDISNSRYFPKPVSFLARGYLNNRTFLWRLLKVLSKKTARKMRFGENVKMYIDELSLPDTAALIGQAGFFIGNDCGPAHISIAMGKPTFVLLGPTGVRKSFAHFEHVYPLSLDYDCQPCQEKMHDLYSRSSAARHLCPYGIRCLRELSVDHVYDYVRETLLNEHGVEI